MMEYSFPTADGAISSITLPTVQANNFEIKPSIIQIIRSSVQFSGLPEEDPNKHLSNFLEICDTFKFNGVSDDAVRIRIFPFSLRDTAKDWLQSLPADRESLYDARERFKGMLRRCPHHELPVWRQVQTFYNGITLANRATIDAAAGGTIMKKLPSEAFNIIDEIATNLYSYGLEKTNERVANVHSIDAITTLSAQMAALTHKVDNLGTVIWNGAPIGPCGACGQMGHLSQDCKVGSQFSIHEDANFVSHGGRSNFNPYSNTYNSGWRSHPNFSWNNNQQQGPPGYQQPQQQTPEEKKSNLKDMLSNFITAANTRFQNQDASIRNLEVQIGQLMLSYAKFLKEVISNKRKWEGGETVKLNEECSAVLQNNLPPKLKDPGSFSIPCTIGNTNFDKALCDLDMEEDVNMPLILGRPFLATSRALIDVQKGQLTLRGMKEEHKEATNFVDTGHEPNRKKRWRNQAYENGGLYKEHTKVRDEFHMKKKKFKDGDKRHHKNKGPIKVDWQKIKHYLEGTLPPPMEHPLLLSHP
ncbi:UNVERIFIED_CONTAM: hypothetical protein Sradi_2119200 [Sesamum radiatum]|uniref:CCHC-type domain-containing protein n=1 Tax=Sesamum radiatum TaxID=300843 RepID=A0AAW2TJI4_SESRA